jgi:peptide-methionine (R)-S-oxide reductase
MKRRTWLKQFSLGLLALTSATKLWALEKLQRTDQEWKQRLTRGQYYILREEGTEARWSSELNEEHRDGEYICAGCDLPLFTSETKYESGSGWPSFYDHIEGHIDTKRDFKLIWPRTEYHCARCGGHQGHVFDDGPKPTGQRWCNNGLALKFVPRA